MNKILILLLTAFIGSSASAQLYKNYLEAAKYAYKNKDYTLASYFLDIAVEYTPNDSIYDLFEIHSFAREANCLGKEFPKALSHSGQTLDALMRLGYRGSYYTCSDSLKLANVYSLLNDSVKSIEIADEVFKRALRLKISWDEKLKLADYVGTIYMHVGKWKDAESAYELAAAIVRRMDSSDNAVRILNMYGNMLYHTNKYADALAVYKEQRDMCCNLHGENSIEYKWANYCVANIMAYMGDIDGGRDIYSEVIGWYRNKIFNELQTLPSLQRELFLSNTIDILQNSIPFGIEAKYNEDEFTRLSYDCLLQSKGLLLATEQSTDAIVRLNGTADELEKLNQLKTLQHQLSELRADHTSDPKDVLNTYAKIKTLDIEIAQICYKYGNNTSFASVDYNAIRNSLKDDEVLLDFTDFKPASKPRQYVCFEIRKNQQYPKVHYICNGAELDSLLTLENNVWSNLYTGESGEDMARIVAEPLKSIIGESKTVYYVPSGIFHKLSLEAIPTDEEDRFGDRYAFHRLSSARELVNAGHPEAALSAQIYGGLNYGEGIKSLPRSLDEANAISQTLSNANPMNLLTEGAGTEESFTAMSGNAPQIIHVSTHGFYYAPTEEKPASLQGYNDAMTLSGLVMSDGSLSAATGLLTAEKVSHCDLSNTSLACLASCHSGQGEVTPEGIYGLQRAFKKAGVGTVIMSLWKASDVATSYFMTNFYDDLVNGSKDRHKAFQYAKTQVRDKYPQPFYWAGFVMID